MASYCYSGKVEMKPEVEENIGNDFMEDEGYPFAIPKVYLEGCGEQYYPQLVFDWEDDSVVLVRDKRVLRYTRSNFVELLAKDEEGNVVWMDGRNAPYSGCWGGKYLNEERGAIEYKIEEYNLEQSEKKTYKVVLKETSKMTDHDRSCLKDFVDTENFQMTEEEKFEIEDGVLKSYRGYDTDLMIPEGVTSIEWNALPYRGKEFERITMPKTLIEIPNGMFRDVKVKEVNVEKENPRYYTKNGFLIDRQNKTLVWAYSGSEIPTDGSIECISVGAFRGRTDLKNIVIPDSVVAIGNGAFEKCDNLEEISIPNSITELSRMVFYGCKNLRKVKLPTSIKKIGENAFDACESLESLVIPNQAERIEKYAFYGCTSLKEIVIPDSVVEIGEYAFNECSALVHVEIPTSITKISTGMFFECTGLTAINIPDSVNKIKMKAFQGCTSLKYVDIPTSVVEIENYVFWDCKSLSKIIIPDSVRYIGEGCFFRCVSLENVKLPARTKVISQETFKACVALKNIELPLGLLKIERQAFSECTTLTSVEIPEGLIEIESEAFSKSGIVELSLPESIKLLDDNALAGCMELRNFDVPEVFQGDEERIFGGGLQRETDGRYLVKGSSARNFSGFVF